MALIPLCVKTPKGIDEVERRTHRLPMRQRQVLIMVDGKRDFETLLAMFPGDTLQGTCQQLIDDGFIVALRKPDPTPAVPPLAAQPLAAPPAARPSTVSTPTDDSQRLTMARNFMMNTLNAFVGVAASSLIVRIETAGELSALHALFVDWRDAMTLTGDGRKQLPDLQAKLIAIDPVFAAVPAVAPSAPVPPAAQRPQAAPPADDAQRLTMARNFMMNTLNAFVGVAASSLISRIEGSPSIEELRHSFNDWREAVSLSRDGRKQLAELETKLAALLS